MFREVMEGLQSYAVVGIGLVLMHSDTILALGSLFLLLVRLVVDLPRAFRMIKNRWVDD